MTRSVLAFTKHYAEMVLVMFVGMLVMGGAMLAAAAALGYGMSEVRDNAPAVYLTGMGLSMTGPMVWWMHRRGHTWPANRAMALAMVLSTVVPVAMLGVRTVTDFGALLAIQHTLMFPGMLVAMLAFRTEYTHGHGQAYATA